MATPEQHAALYGEVQAQVLARFFAYSRYFRANLISHWNFLGYLRSTASPAAHADEPELQCAGRRIVRPSAYDPANGDGVDLTPAARLARLPNHELERWRIAFHARDNRCCSGPIS